MALQQQPDVAALLADTLDADATKRQNATDELKRLETEATPLYVVSVASVLGSSSNPSHIRQAAGLALKNSLTAREIKSKESLVSRWQNLDPAARTQVRELGLTTLADEDSRARYAAAQAISQVAAIELPCGLWDNVVGDLLGKLQASTDAGPRQAILQTLGLICEALDTDVLENHSDTLLTALVQGARKDEPSPEVQLAALQGLTNALPFVKLNFSREGERNYIMQVVCEATQSANPSVQIAAFECLVRIISLYYYYMPVYMDRALFGLTITGMKSQDEHVVMQAIEFWSTICEEEIDIKADEVEANDLGESPERVSHHFARLALPEVLPTLLNLLIRPKEEGDEDNTDDLDTSDEWSPATAAGTCLTLLSQNVGDTVVGPVVPFVESHINSTNWREREAALMAFGAILDGPEERLVGPLVSQALNTLIGMLQDPVLAVKDTATWVVARIADVVLNTIDLSTQLEPFVNQLLVSLNDHPRVAQNAAWAVINLAEQLSSPDAPHSELSPFYPNLVQALLTLADNSNTSEGARSRTSAYEALATLAQQAPADIVTSPVFSTLTESILNRATQLAQMHNQLVSTDDRNNYDDLHINYCSVLNAIIRRVGAEIAPLADRIMTLLLQLLSTSSKTSSILEDVFIVIGGLITHLEKDFGKYVEPFLPFLQSALESTEDYNLCTVAVGLVGDLARSLDPEQFLPHTQGLMQVLLADLQSNDVNRLVKPAILATLGDIALAIGPMGDDGFVNTMFGILNQAAQMKAEPHDIDTIDYITQLRESVLDAYTGLVGGQKQANRAQAIVPHVPSVLGFVELCFLDPDRTEIMIKSATGLLGDIAEAFPNGEIKELLSQPWISNALKAVRARPGSDPRTAETKQLAKWAKEHVKKATT